jgi:hypothetical protein
MSSTKRQVVTLAGVLIAALLLPAVSFCQDKCAAERNRLNALKAELQRLEGSIPVNKPIEVIEKHLELIRKWHQRNDGEVARLDQKLSSPQCAPDPPPPITSVTGKLMCSVPEKDKRVLVAIPKIPFEVRGVSRSATDDNGSFTITTTAPANPVHLKLAYDGSISGPVIGVATRLMVMDDFHNARSDELDWRGTVRGSVLDLGEVAVDSPDCELWRIGVNILKDFHSVRRISPPAGQLRIKRFSGVLVGGPYTFYDYVVLRTDFVTHQDTRDSRESTLFHEFGHSVRHVSDGSETHWHGDNARWVYARVHDGTELTNAPYAFNEGWADYWNKARNHARVRYDPPFPENYRYWNEYLVANKLLDLSDMPGVGDEVMLEVLEANAEQIHSIYDFEEKLYKRLSKAPPVPPSPCPPGYTDDGLTCRLDVKVVLKPSYARGVGAVPKSCAPGEEYDAGLCYPVCKPGYGGVGPICWGTCPAGYDNHGATCFRGASIITANVSKCPWYDICGLTFASGCSVCPPGYHNDGCFCRINVDVILKPSYGRGVGTVPNSCPSGQEYDAGLCYSACKPGYRGIGPICWGTCPAGYDDHGATCYRGTDIIYKY